MIIRHRINSSKELKIIPTEHGAEIDLRLFKGEIILAHDPHTSGEKFDEWLQSYRHSMIVLNVKEDGLEEAIVDLLKKHNIQNYFFLDQPFPTLRKSALALHSVATRLSEYENPVNQLDLEISWIWLDSFTGDWSYLEKHAEWLRGGAYKLCLVSPELQGRSPSKEARSIMSLLQSENINISAICTKDPGIWKEFVQ